MFSPLSLLVTTSLYLIAAVDAAPSAPSKRQSDNGACQQLTTNCVNTVDKSLNNVFSIESCVLAATCFNGQRPVDNFLAFVSGAKNGNSVTPPKSVNLPRVSSTVMNSISTNAKFISQQNFIDAFYGQLAVTNGPWPSSASVVINYFQRVAIWTAFCAGDVPFRNFQDYYQFSASVSSPGCPVTQSSSIPHSTASPVSTSTIGQPVTITPSTVGQPTISHPSSVTSSTLAPSGPVTVSTSVVPSDPVTSSTVVPSGPITISTVVPSGPVTISTVEPSGPTTASTVVPSGPVTISTVEPSSPTTISTVIPSGTVTASTIIPSGTVTSTLVPSDPSSSVTVIPSTVVPSGTVTSSSISSSGSVTTSTISLPGPVTSSTISSSGSVTTSTISFPGTVTSSSISVTSFTVPSTIVPSTTFSSSPPTGTPPTLSSDRTCQQMLFTCGSQVNSAVNNLWSIKACILGAACVDGDHPVGTFASAIHLWKQGGSPPTAPVNQPRVSTALFGASSTDGGKTWSQQNFIDAYYSQLSTTNGPFPPNANLVISYYKRIAAWTGFCGKSIPYMNFADYFQWSATVDGPATTC